MEPVLSGGHQAISIIEVGYAMRQSQVKIARLANRGGLDCKGDDRVAR